MVHAKVRMKEIDYGKSFENLFPMGMEKCRAMGNPNLAVRFLLKLGDASMPAVFGILSRMEDSSKGELLCALVNLYGKELVSGLNGLLKEDELGKNIKVGEISMVQDAAGLSFDARKIEVNYSGIMKNDAVREKIGDYANQALQKTSWGKKFDMLGKVVADGAGLVAGMAAEIDPKGLEKKALAIMEKGENKNKLIKMAGQALASWGLCLQLEDIVFVQEEPQNGPDGETAIDAKEKKFEFSYQMEEELLEAVAGYLKDILKE